MNTNVIDGMKEKLEGLPFNLNRPGRRFLQEGPIDRLINRTSKISYYVYLFNDIIIYAEKKRKGPHKYVTHKNLKDCLFVDYLSSNKGLKYMFEIKNIDSKPVEGDRIRDKEEFIFIAKSFDQKHVWKRDLELQINLAAELCSDGSSSSFNGVVLPDGAGSSAGSTSSLPSEPEDLTASPPSYNSSVSSASDTSYLSTSVTWGSVSSGNSDQEESIEDELEELEITEPRTSEFIIGREDGSLQVLAGSVSYITWLLMYTNHNDTATIQAFLFTYKSFITPNGLLDILQEIYDKNVPPKDLPIGVVYSHNEIRKKVASFLRIWVSGFFTSDFDKELYNRLLSFVDTISRDLANTDANEIKLAVLRGSKEKIEKKLLKKKNARQQPPTPVLGEAQNAKLSGSSGTLGRDGLGGSNYGNKFNEFSLTSVAEHLAHMEHSMFSQIGLNELARMAWKDPKLAKTASPHVLAYTAKFNLISQWVSTELLYGSTAKQRALSVERFVSLAKKCAEMNNFHSLMEILAGINRGYVDRLKKTWALVSKGTMDTLNELNELMDSKQNFKQYRDAMRKAPNAALPYFGLFMHDIVFIEEGNSDKTEGLVNYCKIQMLAKVYREILYYQRKKYPPCEDENIVLYFKQLWTMPDEVLYQISRNLEPSASRANTEQHGESSTHS